LAFDDGFGYGDGYGVSMIQSDSESVIRKSESVVSGVPSSDPQ
jgi:hypothetical protein